MNDERYRHVELGILPARYPSGAEAPLVQLITGQRLATGERATERGHRLHQRRNCPGLR